MTENDNGADSALDIDAILKDIAEPYNRTIAEQFAAYDSANVEVRNADENRQRFEKAAEASKTSAEAINLEIRDALRSREIDSKAAHKKRAERAGHLEDVEIYTSMAKEAEVARAASELKARNVASSILDTEYRAQAAAEIAITEHLTAHIASYRSLMLFVGVSAERAGRGDSAHYNLRHDIHTPIDYALNRLQVILHEAFIDGVPKEFGSRAFLHPIPEGFAKQGLTHLQAKRLESELSAMTAAL